MLFLIIKYSEIISFLKYKSQTWTLNFKKYILHRQLIKHDKNLK